MRPSAEGVYMANTITVTSQTIRQAVVAGCYNEINDAQLINNHFSFDFSLVGQWRYFLEYSSKDVSSEVGKAICETDGRDVGRIEHLLALGALHPELQLQAPIIALGSVCWVGTLGPFVPGLCGFNYLRFLQLNFSSGVWPSSCRFLSVSRVS